MAGPREWIHLQRQLLPVPPIKEAAPENTNYNRNALRRHREAIEAALKRGHLKLLNKQLILDSQLRTEGCAAAAELEYVQRISLGHCHVQALDDIDLISCVRLRICNLESCYISDISAFYGCVNLLKLDLTNNQITTLPTSDFWSSLSSLRVLYLSDNAISEKTNLSRLNGCPQLHVLTLNNTPLSFLKNYRHHVVNSIMSLRALDKHVISDEEIIENLRLEEPFQPMSDTFRLTLYQSSPVGTSLKEEVRGVYKLLLYVDRLMARYSPVMLIQRWIRGWLIRKALMQSKDLKIRALVVKRQGVSKVSAKEKRRSSRRKISPISSNSSPNRKTIAAQVPTTSTLLSPRKQKAKSSTPPPPPTTPKKRQKNSLSRSIDTHVLGIDQETSQLRYTMHINLNKLQEVVAVAEQSEPEGVSKTFKRAFVRKPQPQLKHKSTNKGNKFEEEDAAFDKQSHKSDVEMMDDENCEDNIELTGKTATVFGHDQLPDLATCKKEDGKALRAAEKAISDTVARIRQPPQPIRELRPKPLGKEQHSFTRAYATMNLSSLRTIEKVRETRKKGDELIRKANLVSKIKQERVVRRTRIEEYQRSLRENILEWKSDEIQRLEEARNKQKEQHQMEILKQSRVHDDGVMSVQKQLEDQAFASDFNRQNTLVGGTLSKEDRKISKEGIHSKTREQVQEARKLSIEQQELVKKYMESRRAQLVRDGAEIKRELDIKTLEAVSQRLMEAKRKVAKEVARKQAARVTIAEVKKELRYGPRGPGEQRPAYRGNPVRTESDEDVIERREKHWEAFVRKQSEYTTPTHVKRMSVDAHKTWQRGAEAMEEAQKGSHHFPILPASSSSAIMYEMMAPGPVLTSQDASPLTSSNAHCGDNANNSANSSMLISNYQTVR